MKNQMVGVKTLDMLQSLLMTRPREWPWEGGWHAVQVEIMVERWHVRASLCHSHQGGDGGAVDGKTEPVPVSPS